MNRRSFLRTALAATASGLLVPEWLLDPPKGRSRIAVPALQQPAEFYSLTFDVTAIHQPRLGQNSITFAGDTWYWATEKAEP